MMLHQVHHLHLEMMTAMLLLVGHGDGTKMDGDFDIDDSMNMDTYTGMAIEFRDNTVADIDSTTKQIKMASNHTTREINLPPSLSYLITQEPNAALIESYLSTNYQTTDNVNIDSCTKLLILIKIAIGIFRIKSHNDVNITNSDINCDVLLLEQILDALVVVGKEHILNKNETNKKPDETKKMRNFQKILIRIQPKLARNNINSTRF